MTMMQKIQAKKSKKGFTLVELVIVIAILAILAAIAIPVITTTINSSKLSTFKSDGATTAMLVKEAVNNRLANIETTTYQGTPATDDDLDVKTVLAANDVDCTNATHSGKQGATDSNYFKRYIGGKWYAIQCTVAKGVMTIETTEGSENALAEGTTIKELADSINTTNNTATTK